MRGPKREFGRLGRLTTLNLTRRFPENSNVLPRFHIRSICEACMWTDLPKKCRRRCKRPGIASEFGHQEISNEHFLIALLAQHGGRGAAASPEAGGVPCRRSRRGPGGPGAPAESQRRDRATLLGSELRTVLDGAEKEMGSSRTSM